jgi:hypothetical protein
VQRRRTSLKVSSTGCASSRCRGTHWSTTDETIASTAGASRQGSPRRPPRPAPAQTFSDPPEIEREGDRPWSSGHPAVGPRARPARVSWDLGLTASARERSGLHVRRSHGATASVHLTNAPVACFMDTPDAIARFVDSVSRVVVNSQQTARGFRTRISSLNQYLSRKSR